MKAVKSGLEDLVGAALMAVAFATGCESASSGAATKGEANTADGASSDGALESGSLAESGDSADESAVSMGDASIESGSTDSPSSDSGGDDSALTDSAVSDATSKDAAPVCQDGAKQCLFNGVRTCMAGSWGDAVACPSSTPNCVAGVCAQPPSCQVSTLGTTNCGAGGSGTDSCCASPEVPGGTYYRTYDPPATDGGITLAADGGPTGEADPATVSDFRLDRYLVTVGRFRQYVNYLADGGASPTNGSGKHVHLNVGQGLVVVDADLNASAIQYEQGWYAPNPIDEVETSLIDNGVNLTTECGGPVNSSDTTWTLSPGANENLPVGCVTWYEAYGFCIWDEGFLPSEAEWGYAAAGGSQQREYPWGATAPGTENQYEIYCDEGECNYASAHDGGLVAPVGTPSLGVGRWGQLDLAGEMKEWMLDFYNSEYVDPCTDCGGYSQAASGVPFVHVFRDWHGSPLSTYRGAGLVPDWDYGFRCARTP